ncbi:MAG TPA: TolC family protein [Kofleriaceae bacterium]|jgi:outer membrane protein TolC|nr:TolC family protein [Kofleriaceae bacterium]
MKVRVVVAALGAIGALVHPGAAQPAAPGAAAPPEPIHGLRLEDAIQLAMTRNERAQIAQLNVVIAEAGVARARSAFLPVLSANGNDTLHWRETPLDTAQGTLRVDQPLIDPTAWPLYAQAQHELSGQRAQSVDDRRQLAFDAAKAFIAVLLDDQVVQAAQRKLDTARADLADTEAQAKAQLVSSNDVTRARIGLGSSERELASDQGALDAAYLQLALLVKAPVAPGLVVPAELLDAGIRAPPPSDALVAQSLARRPDLAARKDAALAAHDFAREPRMRWLPSLGLTGQLTASSRAAGNDHNVTGTAALTASWTIFDAGTLADTRSRDAQAAIADLTTDSLIRTIDVQVRSAAVALVSAQQALAAAQGAMDAARKSASETAVLYHQQLAKAIELLDANEQRFAAEVNFAEAQFSVASAYLALRQAMGLDPLGELLP